MAKPASNRYRLMRAALFSTSVLSFVPLVGLVKAHSAADAQTPTPTPTSRTTQSAPETTRPPQTGTSPTQPSTSPSQSQTTPSQSRSVPHTRSHAS